MMSENLFNSANLFDFYFKIERALTSTVDEKTNAYKRAYDTQMRQASEVSKKANSISQNKEAYRTYIYNVQEKYKEELRNAYTVDTKRIKDEVDRYTSKINRRYADLKDQEKLYAIDEKRNIESKFNFASTLKSTFSDSIKLGHSGKFLSFFSKLLLSLSYFAGFYLLADIVVTALKKSGFFPYDIKVLPIPSSTISELIMLFILCVVVLVVILNIIDAYIKASKDRKENERIKGSSLASRRKEIKKIKNEIDQMESQFATFRKNNSFYFKNGDRFSAPSFDNVSFLDSTHLKALHAAEAKVKRTFDISVFPLRYKFEIK